jgi:uncharacterized protein (DUF1684 family)
MTELEEFRHQKDEFFQHSQHSPLNPDQRLAFAGLRYFPENSELDLTVEVEKSPTRRAVQMATSTGTIQDYDRHGRFSFTVEGQAVGLTIYRNSNGFFLPFVDSLAGKQTYPQGRYLEPVDLGRNQFRVNFNLAYNPYCAYNELWSCPITPSENRIPVPIRAGEMLFRAHG